MRRGPSPACIAIGLVLVMLVSAAHGQGRGNTPSTVPVTSTVQDFNESSGAVFQLQSDFAQAYTSTGGVVSQFYSEIGDWVLDLSGQSARTVRLTFDPLIGSPAGPTGSYSARVLSRCFDGEGNKVGVPSVAPLGTSNERCSIRINFTANRTSYVWVASPLYSGTTPATVTCVAGASTCTAWTLVPGTSADPTGALYRVAKNGSETLAGFYHLTYSIRIAR